MAWFEPIVGECIYLWREAGWLARAATAGEAGVDKLASARAADAVGRIGLASAATGMGGSLIIEAMSSGLGHGTGTHAGTNEDTKPGTDQRPKTVDPGRPKRKKPEPDGSLLHGFDYAGFAIPVHGLITPDTFLGVGRRQVIHNGPMIVTDDTRNKVRKIAERVIQEIDTAMKKRGRRPHHPTLEQLREIRQRFYDAQDVVRRLQFHPGAE